MKKYKIYLETTLFNYYFDSDRDAHADTVRLFAEIKAGKYEAYTSETVITELKDAPNPKRDMMLNLVNEYGIKPLATTEKARKLTNDYIAQGIIPVKYKTDGIHIAVASVEKLDAIVSLNFQHIVKDKVQTMTNIINTHNGYRHIKITTPKEILKNENS